MILCHRTAYCFVHQLPGTLLLLVVCCLNFFIAERQQDVLWHISLRAQTYGTHVCTFAIIFCFHQTLTRLNTRTKSNSPVLPATRPTFKREDRNSHRRRWFQFPLQKLMITLATVLWERQGARGTCMGKGAGCHMCLGVRNTIYIISC